MLKIINKSKNEIFYATSKSAGFDICASETCIIAPGEVKIVPTGLYLDPDQSDAEKHIDDANSHGIPLNVELQIRPRSGLAAKHGVTVLNSPGTVDLDFPNEIKVILINHGWNPFEIKEGDRIAQGVIAWCFTSPSVPVKDVTRTGGFGSTNK